MAFYGSRTSGTDEERPCDLGKVLLDAVRACPHDPALLRMMPVFISRNWARVRDLFATLDVAPATAATLGYLVETASLLGGHDVQPALLAHLRKKAASLRSPILLFPDSDKPIAREVALERTPRGALAWNLVTGTPHDSFVTYFEKVASL